MNLKFRQATKDDLSYLVAMLVDDTLGQKREDSRSPLHENYIKAFDAIDKDENNELIVAFNEDEILGMLQLTFIPYLTHIGSWRCLIEGVRVKKDHRSKGIGRKLFLWAISRAKQRKCSMVQLTSNKQRKEALEFYERLGFIASHEGFKLDIS